MKALRYVAALALTTSLFVGSGAAASPPAPTQEAVAVIQAMAPGEELVLGNALITKTRHGLVVNAINPAATQPATNASFCGMALAAAIIGIGAGTLGIIAASTGAGTVIIAGFTLTGAQVGMLAGFSGSYAAVLGWISRYVC